MNIKETPWETRNLDVKSSIEFYFESTDKAEEIEKEVLDSDISYQVAHVPVGRIDILNKLIHNGFDFSETKIELTADLKNLSLPSDFVRFSDGLDYHRVDAEELKMIYAAMRDGVFDTDKVSLDPHFDVHVAGNRYVYWTKDIIDANCGYVYIVTRGTEKIGFFVLKKSSERLGDSFLAGLFDKDKYSGFGFAVLYYPMAEAKKMGLKKIITGVSSNNPSSVKMHLALGYQIKNMDYTLVKHVEED